MPDHASRISRDVSRLQPMLDEIDKVARQLASDAQTGDAHDGIPGE
jgi:hypothetical protein